MPYEVCSECSGCSNRGFICSGQAGVFFPELCPHHDQYVGHGRWE